MITRTWRATDACGNATNRTQTITVKDTQPPAVTKPQGPDGIVECPANPAFIAPVFTDACDGIITPSVLTTTNVVNCQRIVTRRWIAVDGCGNVTNRSQRITLVDTTPPVLIGVPADTTASCNNLPFLPDVTATDLCSGSVAVTFQETITDGKLGVFVLTRTWKAVDSCGNTATASQKIRVTDALPPTITCPLPVVIDAAPGSAGASLVDLGAPVAADSCGVASITNDAPAILPVGTHTVVWTVTDHAGNKATCSQRVVVRSASLPVVSIADARGAVGNSGVYPLTFKVSLDHPGTLPIVVDFGTENGTAQAGPDYLGVPDLTVPPFLIGEPLSIEVVDGGVRLSWFRKPGVPLLQVREGLGDPAGWKTASQLPETTDGSQQVTLPAANGAWFYRLARKPRPTVTFAPGETQKTLTITTFGTAVPGSQRTFTVQLWDALNATLGRSRAQGTLERP